jgi:hypothetical protein
VTPKEVYHKFPLLITTRVQCASVIAGKAELENKERRVTQTCDLRRWRHVPEELWGLAQAVAGD